MAQKAGELQLNNFLAAAEKINYFKALEEMTTYSYDANGNITGWDYTTLEYTEDNQIKKASINGIVVGEYSYDSMRRRVSKTSLGITTNFIYDQQGNLIAEADSSTGNIITEYIYLGGRPVALSKLSPVIPLPTPFPAAGCASLFLAGKGDPGTLVIILIPMVGAMAYSNRKNKKRLSAIILIYGSAFGSVSYLSLSTDHRALASVNYTEATYYYHLDHLGTPKKLTDQTRAIVWDMDLDPFGNEPAINTSTITNNLRFPGQYADSETGLYYNMNRYYEPRLGRYLQPDLVALQNQWDQSIDIYIPIQPEDLNLFPYVNNSPLMFMDPLGLLAQCTYSIAGRQISCTGQICGQNQSMSCVAESGNNTGADIDQVNVGPLPVGNWTIYRPDYRPQGATHSNWAYLRYALGTGRLQRLWGRDNWFAIHPGSKSKGCIIISDVECKNRLFKLLTGSSEGNIAGHLSVTY